MMSASPAKTAAEHLLVRAARGERVERPPVWAMRQAGRWDPEFNRLREGHSFYEFSENVDLAAQASLLPRRFGVDAIILFYDITTLTVAMGLPFTLAPKIGPVPDKPIRTAADVARLDPRPNPERFRHIVDLLTRVKRELKGELPVIVFAGAPFTLATYCIGTGKNLVATRRFAQENEAVWESLLDRVAEATVHFLGTLVNEGADVYQLFDSWAGGLENAEYQQWAHRYHRQIFSSVTEVPRVLFVKECPFLELAATCGADVVSLGVTHDLAALRSRYPQLVFQGNVDEKVMRTGTPEQVADATRRCIMAGGGQRHIVNLSHGMNRDAPVENFEAYIEAAKQGLRP
ncbi:MAG: uroporphyrinogen decarboxylase [Gemmatales bacterium]|nr:MAG: uroporphyrinogen decarboxylase [Gemmatales bacterium]